MASNPKDKKVTPAPIIIKRIKKGGAGHHGGAWKIAYADFVTAMMAFFLLMWLLGSTTQADLQGISAFFQNPVRMSAQGGSGTGDATSLVPGGGTDLTRRTGQVRKADGANAETMEKRPALKSEIARREREQLERLKMRIVTAIDSNPRLSDFKRQVKIELTPEGLVIHLVDEQQRPMFANGSAVVNEYMRDMLREVGRLLNEVENKVTVTGHTDSAPYSGGERYYSNWELSADRANASRRELVAGGIVEGKILRVVGLSSVQLFKPDDPRDASNRRITITVMNKKAEARAMGLPEETEAADVASVAATIGAGQPPATAIEAALQKR